VYGQRYGYGAESSGRRPSALYRRSRRPQGAAAASADGVE
jgi:hypothetical protein